MLAAAAQTLKDGMNGKVSERTIRRWVTRFSGLVDAPISMLKLPHGIGAMSVDEEHFKGRSRYLLEIMCGKRCHIVIYGIAGDNLNYDATGLLQKAVKTAGIPLILPSHKLREFGQAHQNVICAGPHLQTLHIANAAINM